MAPAFGDPGTTKRRLAAVNLALPGLGSLCLPWLGWETPTALPAMKVCLFSNPDLWTIGRHQKGPHRRCFKASSVMWLATRPTGLVTSRVPSRLSSPFEGRGTPTGTCDFGQARYREIVFHNQLKSAAALKKIACQTMLRPLYPEIER